MGVQAMRYYYTTVRTMDILPQVHSFIQSFITRESIIFLKVQEDEKPLDTFITLGASVLTV